MPKQKRYTNEAQIIASIDRAHELENKDIHAIHSHRMEIARLLPYQEQIQSVNFHKAQVELLEKRIKGREGRLARMKQKLAEFRTLTFPGMSELMDITIAR